MNGDFNPGKVVAQTQKEYQVIYSHYKSAPISEDEFERSKEKFAVKPCPPRFVL